MTSQHIEVSDPNSDRGKEHDILPHGVLVNKPNWENPKPNYVDTAMLIDWHKLLPGWEVILKNF